MNILFKMPFDYSHAASHVSAEKMILKVAPALQNSCDSILMGKKKKMNKTKLNGFCFVHKNGDDAQQRDPFWRSRSIFLK